MRVESADTTFFAMSSTSGNPGSVNEISLIYDVAAELSKLKSWIDIESNDSTKTPEWIAT